MTLRLVTAAFACGLVTYMLPAPAEAGGISIRVGGGHCGSRYFHTGHRYHSRHYHYRAPRRTIILDRHYRHRPRVIYRDRHYHHRPRVIHRDRYYHRPTRHYGHGYTYRGDDRYYPSSVRVRSHSYDRHRHYDRRGRYDRPRVVYSPSRGYSRHLDRGYVRSHRGGDIKVKVDFD